MARPKLSPRSSCLLGALLALAPACGAGGASPPAPVDPAGPPSSPRDAGPAREAGGAPGTGGAPATPAPPRDANADAMAETPRPPDAASEAAPPDLRPDAVVADTSAADLPAVTPGSGPMPPATWKEHWFDHTQTIMLHAYDEHAAIYVDADVDRTTIAWLLPFMSRVWQYTKQTYGADFGPDPRLYSIHHQGRYGGGHPSTYFDASHDLRNVSDCGPGPWRDNAVDLPSHEVGHVVEGANNGVHGSPAFPLWRDSKWAEFYQYDLYMALGMTTEAQRLYNKFNNTTDAFPRAGTRWFRDWFFPLWRDHGKGQVMARFFKLLAQHFPKRGKDYARDLNWGEFVHFMSGAAGKDLKGMATTAFGWPATWETQWLKARTDFAGVTY